MSADLEDYVNGKPKKKKPKGRESERPKNNVYFSKSNLEETKKS
jgi:hypothetical protein